MQEDILCYINVGGYQINVGGYIMLCLAAALDGSYI